MGDGWGLRVSFRHVKFEMPFKYQVELLVNSCRHKSIKTEVGDETRDINLCCHSI